MSMCRPCPEEELVKKGIDECQEDCRYKFHWESLRGTHRNHIRESQKLFLCHPDSTETKLWVYQPSEVCAISYVSCNHQFSLVQSLSCVQLFATQWTTEHRASLSIANSWSLPKLMSVESVMPSNHLILCQPLVLSSIFPIIRFFPNESVLCIRWPEYWSFSCNISPSNEHSGLISFRMDWLDLPAVQGAFKSLLQDGRGIGRGDHFLFYKFIERTTERWTKFTKQLLIASSGHQAPRKAAHCLRREVGQKY